MVKSFKTLALNWTEQQYRDYPACHYSALSQYAREGFSSIAHLDEPKSSEALTFGSLVDTMITDNEHVLDRFAICDVSIPTDTIKDIIDRLFAADGAVYSSYDKVPVSDILLIAQDNYKNLKDETKLNKIAAEGAAYYNFLAASAGKEVVSSDVYAAAKECYRVLTTADNTCELFNTQESDDIEILYQQKFLSTYLEIPVKIMVDILKIDHANKTVQPYDLKTTGYPEYKFVSSFIKWGYNIQAEMYYYVLEQLMKQDDVFKDYTLLPFKFIVINKDTLSPLIWAWDTTGYVLSSDACNALGLYNWKELIVRLRVEEQRELPIGVYKEEANNILRQLITYKQSLGADIKGIDIIIE